MRVEASGPIFSVSPLITTLPVNLLHEPFPATRPASGNASVAFPPGSAGVPARSVSIHSVPGRETCVAAAVFGGFAVVLLEDAHEERKGAIKPKNNTTERSFTADSSCITKLYAVFLATNRRYRYKSRIAPTTDIINPADCPSLYQPNTRPRYPAMNEPASPSNIVTIHPPGSFPGIRNLATAPMIRPINAVHIRLNIVEAPFS